MRVAPEVDDCNLRDPAVASPLARPCGAVHAVRGEDPDPVRGRCRCGPTCYVAVVDVVASLVGHFPSGCWRRGSPANGCFQGDDRLPDNLDTRYQDLF